MPYRLAIDLGTTFTAAATADENGAAILALGNRALQVPSVLYLAETGEILVGESAERRGAGDPARLVREFKRRLGDDVPIMVAGYPHSAVELTGHLLRWVVARATERLGEPPTEVILTHPASWGPYKRNQLVDAAAQAGVSHPRLCTEPGAAGARYAAQNRVMPGDKIVIYDLGGGTFDVCVLEKTGSGFQVLGAPDGVERLGGVDFDDAIFTTVLSSVAGDSPPMNLDDPEVTLQMARLRRDCVEAKEGLSTDVDTTLVANIGGASSTVRLTRAEFQELITPALELTTAAVRRALRSARVEPSQLSAIVLVGGSSRIPAVAELVQREFGVPIGVDIHPKHDIALGALQVGEATSVPAASVDDWTAGPPPGDLDESAVAAGSFPPVLGPVPPGSAPSDAVPSDAVPPDAALPRRAFDPSPDNDVGRRPAGRRRRVLLISAAAAAVAGVAVGWAVVALRSEPPVAVPPVPSVTVSSSSPSPTATPAVVDSSLPRSAPLATTTLAVGMNVEDNVDIYLANIEDPEPQDRLTDAAGSQIAPLISPDRASILYLEQSGEPGTGSERRALWVMAADGTGKRALFAKVPAECNRIALRPAWNPVDQTLLAVPCRDTAGRSGLYLIRTSGEVVSPIDLGEPAGATWGVADPTFSPDGRRLVFWTGSNAYDGGSLYVADLDKGGPAQRLTTAEVPGGDSDPAWSPDGSTLAFRRNIPNGTKLGLPCIYLMPADGSADPKLLVRSEAGALEPTWAPSGRTLAYLSRERSAAFPDGPVAQTWLINTDKTGRRLLWRSGDLGPQSGPSWSRR